jgi:hypothetical protein
VALEAVAQIKSYRSSAKARLRHEAIEMHNNDTRISPSDSYQSSSRGLGRGRSTGDSDVAMEDTDSDASLSEDMEIDEPEPTRYCPEATLVMEQLKAIRRHINSVTATLQKAAFPSNKKTATPPPMPQVQLLRLLRRLSIQSLMPEEPDFEYFNPLNKQGRVQASQQMMSRLLDHLKSALQRSESLITDGNKISWRVSIRHGLLVLEKLNGNVINSYFVFRHR